MAASSMTSMFDHDGFDHDGTTHFGHARFVGRVGVLAAALGIGAVFGAPVIAAADTGQVGSQNSGSADVGASTGSQPGAGTARGRAASSRISGAASAGSFGMTASPDRQAAETTTVGRVGRVQAGRRAATEPSSPSRDGWFGSSVDRDGRQSDAVTGSAADAPGLVPGALDASMVAPAASTLTSPVASAAVPTSAATDSIVAPLPPPAALTAAAVWPAAASAATVAPVIGVVEAILAPLLGSGTGAPNECPLSWAVLAFSRGFGQRKAASATIAPAATAQASVPTSPAGTTTAITWAWGDRSVLEFDPGADKLDFGWMGPGNFDVSEDSGSTVIAIVDNNQSYTLRGLALARMQVGNILARDARTIGKWQGLIADAQVGDPAVSIADAAVAEGDSGTSGAVFAVTLSKASEETVTVAYATADGTAVAGEDYLAASGTLTFAPGTTSQQVVVTVTGDSAVEADETFTVGLSNPVGARLAAVSATATITNDDVAASDDVAANDDVSASPAGTTTAITWAWGDRSVLEFDPGADKLDFGWMGPGNFDVSEDSGSTVIAIVDNNQSYTLRGLALARMQVGNILARDARTIGKWQGLIADAQVGDPAVSIADAAVAEGDSGTSGAVFAVTLSKASEETVTVAYATADGTAVAGEDYLAASGTLTFAPGTTSQQVVVTVTGDSAVEADETFTVGLSNPVGARLAAVSATATITNDDAAATVIEAGDPQYIIGDSIAVGLAAVDGQIPANAISGRQPSLVYNAMLSIGESLQGKRVMLSTGIMNASNADGYVDSWEEGEREYIRKQFDLLDLMGASVLVVGAASGYPEENEFLSDLAAQYDNIRFTGSFIAGADGVHPGQWPSSDLYRQVLSYGWPGAVTAAAVGV